MNTEARKKLTQARTALLLDEPFFGTLAMRLEFVEDPTCETEYTNGKIIGYNPTFIESLSIDQIKAELVHEILHVSNGHAWRRDAREQKQWNEACDYAINPIVVDAGFKIEETWLLDKQYNGMPAEQVYSLRSKQPQDEPQDGNEGNNEGKGNAQDGSDNAPGKTGQGEVRDAPTDEATTLEAEWQVATIQAANAAQAQGKLPGSLKGLVAALKETRVDWRAAMLKFAQETCNSDYSFRQPNKRYVHAGLYLPSMFDKQVGEIVIVIDTSGSCSDAIPAFGANVQQILDVVRPRLLHVIYADDGVQSHDVYEAGDTIKLRNDGGGGTDFRPSFTYVSDQGIEPACLVYLTDLYGAFPTSADFPVLWASVTKNLHAPIGETLYIAGDL